MSIPIRVSDELIEIATQHTKLSYRSITKQIEFWAQIGKEAEMNMTPADIVALVNGEVEIKIIRKKSEPVNFDTVFNEIETDRKSGKIKSKVLKDKIWYEENFKNPDTFIRFTNEGAQTIGKFVDGKFVPEKILNKKSK
jgi:hypothetical protein